MIFGILLTAAAAQFLDSAEVFTDADNSIVENSTLSGTATWTWYESYPRCCKTSMGNGYCGANYSSSAPTDECTKYSGCDYCGDMEAYDHQSLSWV